MENAGRNVVKKKVFRWEITQFISNTSLLAIKVVFDPNEPKLSKRLGIKFQMKNKRGDEKKSEWVETNVLFRLNEIAKIVEFLRMDMDKRIDKSIYYYHLDDEADKKSLNYLFGNSKLIKSIVEDKRNWPVALVFQHKFGSGDNTKTKVIMFVRGIETRKDKFRGYLKAEFLKVIVKDDKGVFIKKISDLELENIKLQLEAIVKITTTIPVIYKLDYLIKLNTEKDVVVTEEEVEEEPVEEPVEDAEVFEE